MPTLAYYRRHRTKCRKERKKYYWRNALKARAKTREWYRKNRAYALREAKRYRAKHRDHHRAYVRTWYKRYRQLTIQRAWDWQRKHPKRKRQIKREWARRNSDKIRLKTALERARRRRAPGRFTPAQWIALCQRQLWRCALCGKRRDLTVDHITPLVRGGSNFISNIQGLCSRCNSRKRDKLMPPLAIGKA